MNAAAMAVMNELPDIVIAYGISDEYRYIISLLNSRIFYADLITNVWYSFVFHKTCALFERRSRYDSIHQPNFNFNFRILTVASKLVTTIVSTFTAYYVHLWSAHFPDVSLTAPLPSFDGRAVQYPSVQNLRDYMSWRQVDCAFLLPFPYLV